MSTLLLILLSTLSFLLSSSPAQAQGLERQLQAFAGREGAGYAAPQDPRLVAARIVRVAVSFIGVLFISYTVYAGYLIMTARGEEEKITKGKNTLRRAVIGVFITLMSYAITIFVTSSLRRAVSGQEAFLEVDIQIGDVVPGTPTCCEYKKSGETQGSFVPDGETCRAYCQNEGAEAGSCKVYQVRRGESCPPLR